MKTEENGAEQSEQNKSRVREEVDVGLMQSSGNDGQQSRGLQDSEASAIGMSVMGKTQCTENSNSGVDVSQRKDGNRDSKEAISMECDELVDDMFLTEGRARKGRAEGRQQGVRHEDDEQKSQL